MDDITTALLQLGVDYNKLDDNAKRQLESSYRTALGTSNPITYLYSIVNALKGSGRIPPAAQVVEQTAVPTPTTTPVETPTVPTPADTVPTTVPTTTPTIPSDTVLGGVVPEWLQSYQTENELGAVPSSVSGLAYEGGLLTPSAQYWNRLSPSEQQLTTGAANWLGISPEDWDFFRQRKSAPMGQQQKLSWMRR